MKACGAKTRSGTPCKRAPMPNGRCKLHGGASLVGVASPQFKHGRYSEHLPARLAGRYQEAQSDGDLLNLHEEIALTDARLSDVLRRVDQGDSAELWKLALETLQEAAQLRAAGTSDATALATLRQLLDKGLADWAAWDEIAKLLEQRRRLVESERKRQVEMQQTITAERAMLLISAVTGIIRSHVADPLILNAIAIDIGKLVNTSAPSSIDAGAGDQ